MVRNGDHRLHRHDHAFFQNGIAIFAQFQTGFAAVVVAQHAERVAIAKATILQQVFGRIHLVQFLCDVAALGAGHQQFLAAVMNRAVDVPQADMFV